MQVGDVNVVEATHRVLITLCTGGVPSFTP